MPNRKVHLRTAAGIGFVVGGLSAFYKNRNEKDKLKLFAKIIIRGTAAAFLAGVGGILPDILEPPTGPDHRKFLHSYVALSVLCGILAVMNAKNSDEFKFSRFALNSLGLGYCIHILLDSRTRKSLPVF